MLHMDRVQSKMCSKIELKWC